MTNWTEIAKLEDIPKLGSRVLNTDTVNIALFRATKIENGRVFLALTAEDEAAA